MTESENHGLTPSSLRMNIRVVHTMRPGVATYSHRTYYRDARERIYAWEKSNNPVNNPLENGRGDRYAYDAEGQLNWAEYEAQNPELTTYVPGIRRDRFTCDALGNRQGTQTIASLGTTSFVRTDNKLNQYTSWTPGVVSYDDDMGTAWGVPGRANGVLMEDGYITAGYNALKQPRFAAGMGMATGDYIWFGYDPLGRCVKRWIAPAPGTGGDSPPDSNPANTTYMYYDGWNMIADGGSDPFSPTRIYLHGARVDEMIGYYDYSAARWNYPHYDARGDCILLTDPSGNLVEQYQYDAFGKVYIYDGAGQPLSQSAWENPFLFQGREWLSELKLYDFRHRLYQPELGRFLQPDPTGFEAGDYNLYRYCHNDPINRSDPMGLTSVETPVADARAQAKNKIAFSGTAEYQKLMTVTGSWIPQWVTIATVPITFTTSGNFSNSNPVSHVVAPGSLGKGKGGQDLKGRTDPTIKVSRQESGLNANLNINYWIVAARYNDLERQHTFGVEGGWSKTKGLLEKGGFWERAQKQWSAGISDWHLGSFFTAESRLQSSLNSALRSAKAEHLGTWDQKGGSHDVPW